MLFRSRERLRGRGTYRGWTEEALDAFVTHALRDTADGQVALKCAPELESTIFSTMPQQLWSRLRRITVPTLLVHGRDDQVIPLQTSLTMLEWIDDSQLHIFGRCGHWTQIEHADAFARLVDGFLSA